MTDEIRIDGYRSCHFCHKPVYWYERTTFYLTPGTIQMNVEVHSECLEKWRTEHPKDPEP